MCAAQLASEAEDAPAVIATTGLNCQTISFEWEIPQFDVIKHIPERINEKSFQITVPPGLNCVETSWKLSLHANGLMDGVTKWIELRYMLTAPDNPAGIYSYLSARLGKLDEDYLQYNPAHPDGRLDKGTGNLKLGLSYPPSKFVSKDGALTIHISLSVFSYKPQSQVKSLVKEKSLLKEEHRNGMFKLANGHDWADVELISKDGARHSANKAILSVRSPVFAKMFKEDRESKTFSLDNISDATLTILLGYINNGKISSNQFETPDAVKKVAHAAKKYELKDLRKYCEELLATKF